MKEQKQKILMDRFALFGHPRQSHSLSQQCVCLASPSVGEAVAYCGHDEDQMRQIQKELGIEKDCLFLAGCDRRDVMK